MFYNILPLKAICIEVEARCADAAVKREGDKVGISLVSLLFIVNFQPRFHLFRYDTEGKEAKPRQPASKAESARQRRRDAIC